MACRIPTVSFGSASGVIGIIASLPREQIEFLEKLETSTRAMIDGVGDLCHKKWRSVKKFNYLGEEVEEFVEASNFLDGDLIESFLDLSGNMMDQVSEQIGVSVGELCERVEELKRLHCLVGFKT
ncbi:DNA damage-binding protein 1a [Morus notabilis]|uniref:DNA damage-binding protein 1a n=1 Tax=Morus notabilis TaxID=981085 RepID=W9RGP5_9ROSA|nr:DNA damage-binding protein 1a [Morus notabilis]